MTRCAGKSPPPGRGNRRRLSTGHDPGKYVPVNGSSLLVQIIFVPFAVNGRVSQRVAGWHRLGFTADGQPIRRAHWTHEIWHYQRRRFLRRLTTVGDSSPSMQRGRRQGHHQQGGRGRQSWRGRRDERSTQWKRLRTSPPTPPMRNRNVTAALAVGRRQPQPASSSRPLRRPAGHFRQTEQKRLRARHDRTGQAMQSGASGASGTRSAYGRLVSSWARSQRGYQSYRTPAVRLHFTRRQQSSGEGARTDRCACGILPPLHCSGKRLACGTTLAAEGWPCGLEARCRNQSQASQQNQASQPSLASPVVCTYAQRGQEQRRQRGEHESRQGAENAVTTVRDGLRWPPRSPPPPPPPLPHGRWSLVAGRWSSSSHQH
ncbi:hypothetical protein K504DRAFT_452908 [Pleomassaria siparia CBS 279.74]|uniref:Uncharacterized protein n=1 Tax=Pleomassaria siparia CBS 279.74 TaxID=1314801 RepID=A0A6G1KIN7_9PLEO|nr:hypothetical protein K504DRAFT_452908 [Pleomassaria siparia CBS 279.74]